MGRIPKGIAAIILLLASFLCTAASSSHAAPPPRLSRAYLNLLTTYAIHAKTIWHDAEPGGYWGDGIDAKKPTASSTSICSTSPMLLPRQVTASVSGLKRAPWH